MRTSLTFLSVAGLVVALSTIVVFQYQALVELVESQRVLQASALASAAAGIGMDMGDLAESDSDLLAQDVQGLVDSVFVLGPGQSPDWPVRLAAWEEHVRQLSTDGTTIDQSMVLFRGGVPGMLQPRISETSTGISVGFQLAVLNRNVLVDSLIAPSIHQHSGALLSEFAVRIRLEDGTILYTTNGETTAIARQENVFPFMESIRRTTTLGANGMLSVVAERAGISPGQPTAGGTKVEFVHAGRAGVAATDAALRRQLILLFGAAAFIVAVVIMLVVLVRRAQRLGDQQVQFVAGISHELRTPLASIMALADNLASGHVAGHGEVAEYGTLIKGEGQRLSTMVEDVLEYASGQSFPETAHRSVAIVPFVDDVVARVRRQYPGAEIQVTVHTDMQDRSVHGLERALAGALNNVLVNALEHAGRNGPVDLNVCPGRMGPTGTCRLEVMDRGPGVKDPLHRLSEPFFRGANAISDQIPGNGLGLSVVARVMKAHNGWVTAEDRPGGGTIFCLELPMDA